MPYRLAIPQLNVVTATLLFLGYEFNSLAVLIICFSLMAGVPGFEPGYARIKTWCLTAWRYPN
ncbi:conserved protein of unknown function [Xenorhabdus nematophila AN6/1]|nr:conserved hypothetical protein [Xenorhabdus nematophila str. Websteri]CEF33174.1 conserved hypothetical protein [Xenorhabdus nematophila str. Websteri]CEK22311.1 conserved protein of unknown function [Xenorhabdus nematophila AN6/1]